MNQLIRKNIRCRKRFLKKAAENVSNKALKNYFSQKAKERYHFGHELKEEIKAFNYQIDKDGSLMGGAHKAWMDIKAIFL